MDARTTHSQSPQPSPHGAIGEFPTGIPPSSSNATNTGTAGHTRSSSFQTRPRTPQIPTVSASASSNDELDLNALMAHGQRQLEMDTRSRIGRFSSAAARADSPSRWGDAAAPGHEWRSGSRPPRSRDHSMHRQPSTNSLNGAGSITPVATAPPPTNLSSFLDASFPSPIGAGIGGTVGSAVGGVGVGRPRQTFAAAQSAVPPPPPPGPNGSSDPSAAATMHLGALNTLLGPLIAQNDEVIRLRAEVELWRGEWQRCDRERRRLEGVLSVKNSEPIDGPAFSVVLLDGDGLIFQNQFLAEGFLGGQRAARALVYALPNLAGGLFAPLGDGKKDMAAKRDLGTVVVQVFVNKQGLGHALLKAGSIPSWTAYDAFWQGFTSAHDLFSVIDAGYGKEASDHKIREHLKLYAVHRQCATIFLGASHDNSYAKVLSSLETTSGLSKVVLLKGYSDIAQDLKQYAGRFVTIPDLFRTSRLTVAGNNPKTATLSVPVTAAAPLNDSSSAAAVAASPSAAAAAAAAAAAVRSPGKRRSLVLRPPPPKEHEVVDDATESDSEAESSSPEPDDEAEVIERDNLDRPRRVRARAVRGPGAEDAEDHPVEDPRKKGNGASATVPAAAVFTVVGGKKYKPAVRAASVPTVRNLKPRPCHTFYLSPWGCKNGEGCEYAHHYKLNEEQTEELARLAKEIICPYIRSKRCHFSEGECVYGHRCPRGERCNFGETCRFKDLPNGHGEETEAAKAAAATQ